MKYAALVIALVLGIFVFPQTVLANNNDTNILFSEDAFPRPQNNPDNNTTIGFKLYKSGTYQILIPKSFEVKNFKVTEKSEFYKFIPESNAIEFKIMDDHPNGLHYQLDLNNKKHESGLFQFLIINKETGRYFITDLPINYVEKTDAIISGTQFNVMNYNLYLLSVVL